MRLYPISIRCGVLYRYLIRVRHNLPFDKRNRLPHFLFVNMQDRSWPAESIIEMEEHWQCQNCGNFVPEGLTVCPKCGLVKGGFDESPEQTADGLEIARVERNVKVEISFILYLGAVCSIVLLGVLFIC